MHQKMGLEQEAELMLVERQHQRFWRVKPEGILPVAAVLPRRLELLPGRNQYLALMSHTRCDSAPCPKPCVDITQSGCIA
jgi:hypothetical protein